MTAKSVNSERVSRFVELHNALQALPSDVVDEIVEASNASSYVVDRVITAGDSPLELLLGDIESAKILHDDDGLNFRPLALRRHLDVSGSVTDDGYAELERLAEEAIERFTDSLDFFDDSVDFDLSDLAHEIADGFVNVYTVAARQQFMDLNLWDFPLDDVLDLVAGARGGDLDSVVQVTVYEAARSVVTPVLEALETRFVDLVSDVESLEVALDDYRHGLLTDEE